MEEDDYLVPGRECGACTACCKDLAINADGMDKLAGLPCAHCVGGEGCAIYDARPEVCRTYNCLWRSVPALDDSWRPDLSGVLIALRPVPADRAGGYGVDINLVGPPESLDTDRFAGLVGGFIESSTEAYLSVLPGPGYFAFQYPLNDMLASAVAARDLAGVKALIRNCYSQMLTRPPIPLISEENPVHPARR